MDSIIKDTFERFITPFNNSEEKWYNLYKYTINNKISNISEVQYSSMFKKI